MTYPSFSVGETLRAADMNAVGMWLVGSFSGNGSSNTINCDNVFTSEYQNYRVVISLLPAGVNFIAAYGQFFNTSGTVVSSGYYSSLYSQDYASGTTGFGTMRTSSGVFYIGWVPSSGGFMGATFDVYRPRETAQTVISGTYTGINSGSAYAGGQLMCQTTVNTAMRGFRIQADSLPNLSGTVRVYGYKD